MPPQAKIPLTFPPFTAGPRPRPPCQWHGQGQIQAESWANPQALQNSQKDLHRIRVPRSTKDYASQKLNDMVDSCLKAPTPVRHLTPKQKRIEAEREKLGLISKALKRKIDAARDSSRGGSDEFTGIGTPGLDVITLGIVDGDKVPKYELTVEDGRRLAKEYSRVLMRKHQARQAAESTLLRLKKEAIEALPEGPLREAAMVPDLTPFPKDRFMSTLTPPIEGYMESIKEAAKMTMGKAKIR